MDLFLTINKGRIALPASVKIRISLFNLSNIIPIKILIQPVFLQAFKNLFNKIGLCVIPIKVPFTNINVVLTLLITFELQFSKGTKILLSFKHSNISS